MKLSTSSLLVSSLQLAVFVEAHLDSAYHARHAHVKRADATTTTGTPAPTTTGKLCILPIHEFTVEFLTICDSLSLSSLLSKRTPSSSNIYHDTPAIRDHFWHAHEGYYCVCGHSYAWRDAPYFWRAGLAYCL
jgi:hypothetical protein